MTDFNTALLENRAQVYDSFLQLISGSNRFRLKSLQSSEPLFVFPNLDRIADDGSLFLTPEVSQSTYNQTMVLTTSEVDTVNPPTDTKTISWFIFQKEQRNSVQVEVSCVFVAKETTEVDNTMRLNFTYEVEQFGTIRINEDGDVLIDTVGRILPGTASFVRDTS